MLSKMSVVSVKVQVSIGKMTFVIVTETYLMSVENVTVVVFQLDGKIVKLQVMMKKKKKKMMKKVKKSRRESKKTVVLMTTLGSE